MNKMLYSRDFANKSGGGRVHWSNGLRRGSPRSHLEVLEDPSLQLGPYMTHITTSPEKQTFSGVAFGPIASVTGIPEPGIEVGINTVVQSVTQP